jgi:bifunctional DNA-binding transcriptional regulator/antitoxin component of YhaV-PrlF toxin-antitoxin module
LHPRAFDVVDIVADFFLSRVVPSVPVCPVVRTDERGRVTIPKDVRDRYGEKFRLVEMDSGIKLVPIPDDPLAELRAAASDELREASLGEIEAGLNTFDAFHAALSDGTIISSDQAYDGLRGVKRIALGPDADGETPV